MSRSIINTYQDLVKAPMYDQYARIYDRSGQMRFSILMRLYLQDLLRQHPVTGRTMIDLACGTGTLALLMAEDGWWVLGIDRSEAMLEQACSKLAVQPGVGVRFRAGDMRSFAVETPVDLVTCCYDSLNYLLTEDELGQCFGMVARALVPGGLFCGDLVTDYFLRRYWQGVDQSGGEGWSQVMQSNYDPRNGYSTLLLKGTIQEKDGIWRDFQEVHVERAYPETTVRTLLEAAGLAVEAVYDCFSRQPPNERTLRVMYVARRL